jgi:uncharacterized protein
MLPRYQPLATLQFFGGEPTLNLAAMHAAVDETRGLVADGTLERAPRFAIVTNATRMSANLVAFYRETGMHLTVSHDGPRDVQDLLRPTVRGQGSFDTVTENLAQLRAAGIPFDIQCTYTTAHARAGYRVPDLLDFFRRIGASLVHIVPVTVPEGDPLDVYHSAYFEDMVAGFREAVRLSFHDIVSGGTLRFGMLHEAMQLIQRGKVDSPHYCNAGVTTLTVAANGEIYPCFMFINKQGFVLGHLDTHHERGAFNRDPSSGTHFGCPGRQFMRNGRISPFRPDEVLKMEVVDEVLTNLDEELTAVERRLGLGGPAMACVSE